MAGKLPIDKGIENMYNPLRRWLFVDLSKLSIEYIDGFVGIPKADGFIQKDKILPYITIVYPESGYYDIQVEDGPFQRLEERAGCYITAPFQRHTIVHRCAPGKEFMQPLWLRLSVLYDGALDVTSWFQPPLFVTGQEAQSLIGAIRELCALPNSQAAYSQLYTDTAWDQAFQKMRIAGQVLEALLSVSTFQPPDPETERLSPALTLIRDQYRLHLTVEQLARDCGMSVSAFYRVFAQVTGKSPMQYLNEYRLKQAAKLLTQPGFTLAAIAQTCGFCDEFHLSRNFKRHYGLSPSQYRKQLRIEN